LRLGGILIVKWPESVNLAHAATSRRYNLSLQKDLVTRYYVNMHTKFKGCAPAKSISPKAL